MIGISLGWNCYSASEGVRCGYRSTKCNGYKTCPFDEMNTNYDGLVLCLREDFKYFCDPTYLSLITFPRECTYYPNETLIVNTRYGFIFNHESPGHADLYKTQSWVGGINHFVDNNFSRFIERYTRRIENFRSYVKSGNVIRFLITCPSNEILELRKELNNICSNQIIRFDIQDSTKYTDHIVIMRRVSQPSQISTYSDDHQMVRE